VSTEGKKKKKKTILKKCYKTKIRILMWWNNFSTIFFLKKFVNLFLFFTIWQDFMGSVSKEF
jgi:hypothetical protein